LQPAICLAIVAAIGCVGCVAVQCAAIRRARRPPGWVWWVLGPWP